MSADLSLVDQLEHLKVLRLQPGDVLVLTFPGFISLEQAADMKERWKHLFPEWDAQGVKVLVLGQNPTLGVLRVDEAVA